MEDGGDVRVERGITYANYVEMENQDFVSRMHLILDIICTRSPPERKTPNPSSNATGLYIAKFPQTPAMPMQDFKRYNS